jgi:hypothetical protein
MPHNDFADRFRSVYTGKILTTISALKRKYGDTYRFVFDDRPEDFRNNTHQCRFSLILHEIPKCGPHSFKFIIVASIHAKDIMITGINYDSAGRGLDGRRSLFYGSLDEFRYLDLEELVHNRIHTSQKSITRLLEVNKN